MAEAMTWDVDGLRLAGLGWGPLDGVPVLALHGWMDHAESFAVLAPLLTGCRVVALDLSGQGLSAHRAAHATYNIWDDLPQIAGVLDALGWETCVLLGHSRGANVAALMAAALPERVRALVSLDSLVPEPYEGTVVDSLRAFVLEVREQGARPPRAFATREDYAARRAAQGNSAAVSQALAGRALAEGPEGFAMRADRRLFASSAMKLDARAIDAVLCAIRCPVLNLWAEGGLRATRPKVEASVQLAKERVSDYRAVTLPGDHHFHMDAANAALIAAEISAFLAAEPQHD